MAQAKKTTGGATSKRQTTAKGPVAKPGSQERATKRGTSAGAGQAAFERAFGPIKALKGANGRLLECRLPGDKYYTPDRDATPPMFSARLWTTGFQPEGSDGAAVDDWKALTEAVTVATSIATALKGVSLSTETDCDYYPFVFPTPLGEMAVARHVYAGMGCRTKSARDFEVTKVKKKLEGLFWDAGDDPAEYYEPSDLAKCRAAIAIFQTLENVVRIEMNEDFITFPRLLAGLTESGLLVGVFGICVYT